MTARKANPRPTGGPRPGAGAPRGPRKSTIERALVAERQVLESRAAGRKLAKEVLEEFMLVFAGMAATNQPKPGVNGQPSGNVTDFVKYAELAIHCAERLAPYQSPTFRAIITTPPPPPGPEGAYTTGLEIELTDQTAIARVYKQFVAMPAPKVLPRPGGK